MSEPGSWYIRMKVIHHTNLILERMLVTFQVHSKLNNLLEYQGRTELANPKNNKGR